MKRIIITTITLGGPALLAATDVAMGKAYGTDYSDLTRSEKQQWIEAKSGQVSYEVTVGADGNSIAEPTA